MSSSLQARRAQKLSSELLHGCEHAKNLLREAISDYRESSYDMINGKTCIAKLQDEIKDRFSAYKETCKAIGPTQSTHFEQQGNAFEESFQDLLSEFMAIETVGCAFSRAFATPLPHKDQEKLVNVENVGASSPEKIHEQSSVQVQALEPNLPALETSA